MAIYSCAQCGKEIVRAPSQVLKRAFCSRACSNLGRVVHQARGCRGCGKNFKPYGGRNPRRLFCTRECYEASRSARTITKICPACGKEFTVDTSVADRYTVCSNACKTIDTKYVDCKRCGVRFRAEKRLNRAYCSELCRRPPAIVRCAHCDSEFRKLPGDIDRRFCSFACYRRFKGETLLELKVRQALEALGITFSQEHQVGSWCIDFALLDLGIALEADGDYWHSATAEKDQLRDAGLSRLGWTVVRIPESDVNNATDIGVLILDRLQATARPELASLSPTLGSPERVIISGGDHSAVGFNHRQTTRIATAPRRSYTALPLWGEDEVASL